MIYTPTFFGNISEPYADDVSFVSPTRSPYTPYNHGIPILFPYLSDIYPILSHIIHIISCYLHENLHRFLTLARPPAPKSPTAIGSSRLGLMVFFPRKWSCEFRKTVREYGTTIRKSWNIHENPPRIWENPRKIHEHCK